MQHALDHHPCFNAELRHQFGRIHLPVAPDCNVQCGFCNRQYDCVNESRPGVTSAVLTPRQALRYLQLTLDKNSSIAVVGIAGPGDPFATPELTLETLALVRDHFPEMLLCVASNGLQVAPYAAELARIGVSHVTITVNAVDPEIGAKVYRWFRNGRKVMRGVDGAKHLLERQCEAIRLLKSHNVIVKVNSILLPGINDTHMDEIAKTVAELGADVFNCIPLLPAAGSDFEHLGQPSAELVAQVRAAAEIFLPQMRHCQRCRADASGLLGEAMKDETIALLQYCRSVEHTERKATAHRVAVATFEGIMVNQHLGNALTLAVFENGPDGPQFVEDRTAPLAGGGDERWHQLADILSDCHTVLAAFAGKSPRTILGEHGIAVINMEGLIAPALTELFAGRMIPSYMTELAPKRCGAGCGGNGGGCGA